MEDFINLEEILVKNKKNINKYDFNFTEAIKDNIDTDIFLYQPKITSNSTCQIIKVGKSESNNKPDIKVGEFIFMNDKWTIISHIYNKNIFKKYDTIYLLSLKSDKIIISIQFTIENIEIIDTNNILSGYYQTVYIKDNQKTVLNLIKNKIYNNMLNPELIEILIEELSNPILYE